MPTSATILTAGPRLAAAGLAATLLCVSVQPLSAGLQHVQVPRRSRPAGYAEQFGRPRRTVRRAVRRLAQLATTRRVTRSELPTGDPEVAMILNPGLGTPTRSPPRMSRRQPLSSNTGAIVAQGSWPMVAPVAMKPGRRGLEYSDLAAPASDQRRLAKCQRAWALRRGNGRCGQAFPVSSWASGHGRRGLQGDGRGAERARECAPGPARGEPQAVAAARGQDLNRYIQVNIPAAQVEAVRNGRVELRNTAVVGKVEHPTPTLASKVSQVKFNPWNVPTSIVRADLVPKGRQFASRGEDVLAAYRMEAIDQNGNILDPRQINWYGDEVYGYRYWQKPWEENSLGVKIDFPNKDAVYIHDTPLKSLFSRPCASRAMAACGRTTWIAWRPGYSTIIPRGAWRASIPHEAQQHSGERDRHASDRRLFHLYQRMGYAQAAWCNSAQTSMASIRAGHTRRTTSRPSRR